MPFAMIAIKLRLIMPKLTKKTK